MRTRVLTALAVTFALALPAAAHAAAPATVHLGKCHTGSDADQRRATYRAKMQSVDGSARMAIRFELLVHRAGHPTEQIRDKKLNAWHRSRRDVLKYVYKQTVKQLSPGGSYRARVTFRWYDANGEVVKRAKRVSAACRQTGGLPNLTVTAVSFSDGKTSGTTDYTVSIGNTGESPAENFKVTLIVDGAVVDEREVERLDAGESQAIELNGPDCHRLRAVIDRDHQVDESIEDDNSLRTSCPS
jgi:archaellum component FlaF (FlaF/FlaG flagellin family)